MVYRDGTVGLNGVTVYNGIHFSSVVAFITRTYSLSKTHPHLSSFNKTCRKTCHITWRSAFHRPNQFCKLV